MVASATLRDLLADRPHGRVVSPGRFTDDDISLMRSQSLESTSAQAQTIEGAPFEAHDVAPLESTGFTHFLDGAQRSWRAGFDGIFPYYLAHTSAAVLERRDRDVLPPEPAWYDGGLELFGPADAALDHPSIPYLPVDTRDDDNGITMVQRIADAVSARREGRETSVAREFEAGRLLIDGGIGRLLHGCRPGAFIVGIVKSHQRQYFQGRDQLDTMLNLRAGQRTTVFVRPGSGLQGAEAYSFYLRLHDSPNEEPLYGLVRVEIPPAAAMLKKVDAISAWILHERAPLSLPDSRYDKMLYPVRLVEKHLKALQPTDAAVRALIGI